MTNLIDKAIKTGDLSDEEINSLSDDELKGLYHSMKRHADFDVNQVDFKHAMHLVRLLRMGVESLRDGEILVKRPDAEELLSIRNGAWTYDELIEYAEEMDHEIHNVWYKKTELPKKPNINLAANLLMELQDAIWNK